MFTSADLLRLNTRHGGGGSCSGSGGSDDDGGGGAAPDVAAVATCATQLGGGLAWRCPMRSSRFIRSAQQPGPTYGSNPWN
jgi:hypothetical protein